MNLIRSGTTSVAASAHGRTTSANIYHLHPLVAGSLESWAPAFDRIARMGFSHVCLAPPFEPGANGDIFIHATFDRLHPALGFSGTAAEGLTLAADLAARAGLALMLDIAPGQVAAGSPLWHRHRDWFAAPGTGRLADPRQPPLRTDVAIPTFNQSAVSDAASDWWINLLGGFLRSGVAGFRCLTLDLVPPSFWRRIVDACPEAMFLGWTPDLAALSGFAGVGFDLTCAVHPGQDIGSSAFLQQHDALLGIAPPLVSPERSFMDRLARHLPPQADVAACYRLALRTAAATGAGLFMPMGFEYATGRRFDPVSAGPSDLAAAQRDSTADLSGDVADAIRLTATLPPDQALRPLGSPAAPVIGLLRGDALVVINTDTASPRPFGFPVAPLPFAASGARVTGGDVDSLLRPGEVRVLQCQRLPSIRGGAEDLDRPWAESSRVAIEAVQPGGAFPAKTIAGRPFAVSADIFGDGHDILAADLLWRPVDAPDWQRIRMRKLPNDRWQAIVQPDRIGLYRFAVEGWWDRWATYSHDLRAKADAGQAVNLEIEEGRHLVHALLGQDHPTATVDDLLSSDLAIAMAAHDPRPFAARSAIHSVRVDRPAAEFASWYELFPRSATHDPAVHGTFRSVIERLPAIQAMGFDVLYFPPIHPIGRINRKGRNNSLKAQPGDVGSPYAIGSAEGGHQSTHPQLGTLDDFRDLLSAARDHGLELAIDFAIQCAPDHPWVTRHRDWFQWRPDGSMRYAENPPKKYEDIVNPDFYGQASFPAVWFALRDVIQFWADQGVRTFRVDNPHTKPLPFWQWMIADIQSRHPDAVFLAEAFTRPKLMYRLAKIGFTQSYTYFTWRTTKQELTEYLTEITTDPVAGFFRPNFFVNTPDINPVFLQTSGRAGFLIRAVLAATLSGLWGVYSGFEICEAAPLPGREEYLDSEKYEIRPRDYNAPGNIVAEITALNRIRRYHPALQSHLGVRFYAAHDDEIILYGKRDPHDGSMVLVCVSLNPHAVREADIDVPLWEFGVPDHGAIAVTDLMRGDTFIWHGRTQHIRLDPAEQPFRLWRLEVR